MPDEDGRLTLGERERVESCLSTHHKKCLHCQWEDMAEIQDRLVAVRPITPQATEPEGVGLNGLLAVSCPQCATVTLLNAHFLGIL